MRGIDKGTGFWVWMYQLVTLSRLPGRYALLTARHSATNMEEGGKTNKKTIFVGGIGEDVDEQVILETFSTFGGSCWRSCFSWSNLLFSRRYHRRSTPHKRNRQTA